ncbi:MAG: hypothetical protein FWD15_01795 [Alphaproteobacteria bacterium]|nr:hypothetical protein [Alphaproteobacteria bacterium]
MVKIFKLRMNGTTFYEEVGCGSECIHGDKGCAQEGSKEPCEIDRMIMKYNKNESGIYKRTEISDGFIYDATPINPIKKTIDWFKSKNK